MDDSARAAVALGATQLKPPTDISGVGRITVLRDSRGAQFALFTPSSGSSVDTTPPAGQFAWHEQMADDPDAAFDFHSPLFGWTKMHAMDMGADGVYQMYGRGNFTYGGLDKRPPDRRRRRQPGGGDIARGEDREIGARRRRTPCG